MQIKLSQYKCNYIYIYIFKISVANIVHVNTQMRQSKYQIFYQNVFEQFSELHMFFKQSNKCTGHYFSRNMNRTVLA